MEGCGAVHTLQPPLNIKCSYCANLCCRGVPKQRYDSAHLTENIVINTRRILIVCLPPVQELDIAGPAGVIAKANGALRDRGIAYEIELVTTDPDLNISGEAGLKLLADRHYADVSGPIDTLLTVGGSGAETIRDPDLTNGCAQPLLVFVDWALSAREHSCWLRQDY